MIRIFLLLILRTFLAKGFYLPAIYHNVAARVEYQEKVGEEGDQVAPESLASHFGNRTRLEYLFFTHSWRVFAA